MHQMNDESEFEIEIEIKKLIAETRERHCQELQPLFNMLAKIHSVRPRPPIVITDTAVLDVILKQWE